MHEHVASSPNATGAQMSCPISHVPPEIFDTILDLALPPSFLISPSDSKSPASDGPWRRAMTLKLSLSLVSKSWHAAVPRLLYADVFLANTEKAGLYFDSLESKQCASPTNISSFVRSINLKTKSFQPHQCLSSYVKIKSSCPNLRHIGMELRRPSIDTVGLISNLFLTSLTMKVKARNVYGSADIIGTLTAAAKTVTHLHLFLVSFNGFGLLTDTSYAESSGSEGDVRNDPNGIPSLSGQRKTIFPHLQELELTLPVEYDRVAGLVDLWDLPQMTRVTVHSPLPTAFIPAWNMFRKHKLQIQYFHIDVAFTDTDFYMWHYIQECLKECVCLSHLVLHHLLKNRSLKSDSIRFIDVWQHIAPTKRRKSKKSDVSGAPSGEALRLRGGARTLQIARKTTGGKIPLSHSQTNVFPNLRQIRILDKTLLHLSHLPLDIPPDRVLNEEDEFNMEYDGIHIRHEVGKLIHVRAGT